MANDWYRFFIADYRDDTRHLDAQDKQGDLFAREVAFA